MTDKSDNVPRPIDDYVALVQGCATIEDLFRLYQDEVEREGYQNVVFGRIGGRPDAFQIPYGSIPDGVAKTYFEDRLWVDDPILAASQSMARPFTWIDEMVRKTHSAAAWRVMELAKAHGVRGGMTMPFHRPGGWDLISLSMRDERMLDVERIPIVNLKSYATLQRYLVLEEATTRRILNSGAAETSAGEGALEEPSMRGCGAPTHHQHGEGIGVIGDEECHAMVLVDIAWRRYCAGLIKLNERVPDIVGNSLLRGCIDRGLIEEEDDDDNFRFVFKPSPVGQSHIKLCPCVPSMRDKIWQNLVEVGELPQV